MRDIDRSEMGSTNFCLARLFLAAPLISISRAATGPVFDLRARHGYAGVSSLAVDATRTRLSVMSLRLYAKCCSSIRRAQRGLKSEHLWQSEHNAALRMAFSVSRAMV
jgi:hypothetical protein